jgi:YbbR domain-containing protein
MWVYVSNDQTTTTEQEFKAVPVDVRGQAANLAVAGNPGNVTVRVQADQNIIAELTSRSVEAYIDLDGIKAGKMVVPVQVKVPAGVKVVNLRPPEVSVTLEPMVTKQVLVKIRSSSMPANGFKVLGMQVKPEEVILHGPRSVLNRVDRVSVEVDLKNRNRSFGESLPIRVSDTSGRLLDEGSVQRSPELVDLLVSIGPDLPSKTVKIIPDIVGEPAKGYTVTMTSIDPVDLVITGESNVINRLTELPTKPIDITGAQGDLAVNAEPVLPPGVIANRQSVRILVTIGRE